MSLSSQRILEREFNQRLSLNPHFSKRSFARQLRITPAFLSNLISGRRRLTPKMARYLAEVLELSESEKRLLLDESVGLVTDGVAESYSPGESNELPIDRFEQVCDWWYIAILEFLETSAKDHTPETLARRLGIPKANVEIALKRLLELNIIERDKRRKNRFAKVVGSQLISSQTPSAALRKFHGQILNKANEALQLQLPSEKIVGSMTLAFDPEDLPEVRRRWIEFRKSLEQFIGEGKKRDQVYTAMFEMFSLTRI